MLDSSPQLSVWVGEETGEDGPGWMMTVPEVSVERVWFESLDFIGHVMYLPENVWITGLVACSGHFR